MVPVARADARTPSAHDPEELERALARKSAELLELEQLVEHMEQQSIRSAVRERDLAIARRIQSSLLPLRCSIPGWEIASRMQPSEDLGGDYFDIHVQQAGMWVSIGDVTGHGLSAGLVMLMVQSGMASLVRALPEASPRELLGPLNRMLFENIRRRMGDDDHVTLSLLKFAQDGTVRFSGAHEEMIIWRAATRGCERVPTPGVWLGARESIEALMSEGSLRLGAGDVLLLYTDGFTEAMNSARRQFGLTRLCETLERTAGTPVQAICDALFEAAFAWSPNPSDDLSAVVIRRTADAGEG